MEAETVLEGGDTEVEKPIDQEEPEEVEEEEGAGEMGETEDTNENGGLVKQAKVGVEVLQPKQFHKMNPSLSICVGHSS